ncbi:response regulator transcription factor [Pontiella sulfatireligans]|uniref:Response regulator MprA n=1 Tax=Pontiella sulfatireligans TaxID=2750658 RepID=A0A6C2UMZ7_9BACT|nr:response regulator transcription factor [Pontiella sulfatireligans]VGO21399.1 Response regulator MprA [Pontiella sulfatireligans]
MNHARKILVVEDDPAVQQLLQHNMQKRAWEVEVADSGEAALLAVASFSPDMILLDVMLPGIDGLEVCRQVKSYSKTSSIPVILLSALSQESDVVSGLEQGADDYVVKPFSLHILHARIDAVLRRSHYHESDGESEIIAVHNLEIDPVRYSVKVSGDKVDLTQNDYLVLKLLASQPGRPFSRQEIIEAAHGKDSNVSERSVDVQVVSIRRRIGSAGQFIETVRRVGYRLKEE